MRWSSGCRRARHQVSEWKRKLARIRPSQKTQISEITNLAPCVYFASLACGRCIAAENASREKARCVVSSTTVPIPLFRE